MSFVSYAQNFEDVLLWRALGGVEGGFYIDVGAHHPDTDSVTRAFYDRGWHGIDIEPVAADARRLAAARPRDTVLAIAAGTAEGQADFFVIPGTGLSTLEEAARARAVQAGHAVRRETVRVRPLAAICRDRAPAAIHFLKIDAEGSERAVLEGADFTAHRPWIVLVEATAPMSTVPTHAAWEPILLAAGYRFVWFDGLNRFYVAAERHADLAPHFQAPPNVFDDFVRAADGEWARRVVAAETEAALLRRQAAAEAAAREEAARGAARQRRLVAARVQEMGTLRGTIARLQAEVAAAERVREEARLAADWLAAMRASTSWRLTAPLRRGVGLLAALRGRDIASLPALAPPSALPVPPPSPPLPPPAAPPVLRAVHQFHPGSATGDAITNAMLLTRALLRGCGFASEIYVQHRDPELDGELRLMEELPRHGDYVLIVRHSLGHDVFDRLAALPAPKVLLYHNITPPEFLPASGPLRHYARLGRDQLGQWRGRVAAALADSDYNAVELRAAGFDPVRTCTLLFDIAALRAAAEAEATPPRRDAMFTLLFVGRLNDAKGQRELIAAYALFRKQFDRPSRLVLVGRPDDGDYLGSLRGMLAAEGLGGHVVITGPVEDAELHGWYAAADLYVSLSRHEGFGVPLVEAMAHGVPVLAWPAGAVPYTLGGAAALLAGRDPASVADAMLALAGDAAGRAAIVARQRAALDRFALERQMPVLLAALARAGAVPPEPAATRATLADNVRFTVTGHVRGSYSLAAINRDLAAALDGAFPGRVRLLPAPGEDAAGNALAARPAPDSGPHVVISQHYPVLVPQAPGDLNLALFFWEESLVPAATIATLAAHFRGVLAPSRSVAKALLDSGLPLPVRVVGHAPPLGRFAALRAAARPEGGAFTVLHVSSCFPRKGVDVLLAAYARAFRAGDNVRLVIKGFPNPHNDVAAQLARLRAADPGLAPVELIDRDLEETALDALYAEADVLVLPTRGEGFNLPAAEAMAAGLPLIVTGHGGHADFCAPDSARLVAWRYAASASHLATPHSVWAEPDVDDLAAALREAADPAGAGVLAARAARGIAAASRLGDTAAFAGRIAEAALDLLLAPPPASLRLGVVTTWDVRCGVAEYSRHLLAALAEAEGIGSVTVFADRRTPAGVADGIAVVPAWYLGQGDAIGELAVALAAADPQAVVLQHQPGLFGWEALATLLACPGLAGRVVVVTLHTTRHLETVAPAEQAAALAALAGIGRVLVHTLADLDLLRRLGLVDNVALLPHGAPPSLPAATPRDLPAGAAPVIGCYGFFLPGKGIAELIAALALLRRRWPAARLVLVNAEYPHPASAAEIAACRAAAADAGLTEAVTWHTGFLAHAESLALLAKCDVIALPYQSSLEASSAALRTALGAGVPVLVTDLPLFDEAQDAVARAAGPDPAALAAALAALLGDTARRARVQAAAQAWLAARDWGGVAARLGGMLRGLVAGRNG